MMSEDFGHDVTVGEQFAVERCEVQRKKRIPCVVLTGFLGSGKTSLLNRILEETTLKIAVIENEVGAISVDDKLLVDTEDASNLLASGADVGPEVVLLQNGCLCCRVRSDLTAAFTRIVETSGGQIDGIILEMSGLSEVGPVVQTFFKDEAVQEAVGLDAVICVLDASNLQSTLQSDSVLIREQLALADTAILNKIDTVDPAAVAHLSSLITDLNASCTVWPLSLRERAQSLPESVFGEQTFLRMHSFTAGVASESTFAGVVGRPSHAHHHDALGFSSFCHEVSGLLDKSKIVGLLERVHEARDADSMTPLVRCKGVVNTPAGWTALQGIYEHVEFHPLPRAPASRSQFVFIGRLTLELREKLKRGIEGCIVDVPRSTARPPPAEVRSAAVPAAAPSPAPPLASAFGARMGGLKGRRGQEDW